MVYSLFCMFCHSFFFLYAARRKNIISISFTIIIIVVIIVIYASEIGLLRRWGSHGTLQTISWRNTWGTSVMAYGKMSETKRTDPQAKNIGPSPNFFSFDITDGTWWCGIFLCSLHGWIFCIVFVCSFVCSVFRVSSYAEKKSLLEMTIPILIPSIS